MKWKRVLSDLADEPRAIAATALERMDAYCTSVTCRQASLVEHFGQTWNASPCDACDVCLGTLKTVENAASIGRSIVTCVRQVREQFAASHVAKVLAGSRERRLLQWRHDRLDTWGVLKQYRRENVRQWIEQLVGQGFLVKDGEFQLLRLTKQGRYLLKGKAAPTLLAPAKERRAMSSTSILDSWEGVDNALFEALRDLRRKEAIAREVPAYVIFSDATLRDMARRRPSTVELLLDVHGVGRQKAADFGQRFVDCITCYCTEQGVSMGVQPEVAPHDGCGDASASFSLNARESFPLFERGLSVQEVAERLGRAVATVYNYLETYIRQHRITDASQWVPPRELEQLEVVVQYAGTERMRPIHDALHGRVGYGLIRVFLACRANRRSN